MTSFVNQPSRLLISSDDTEWGTGNNFNITLPEPILNPTGCDLLRAVIPNTQYPIPNYQNNVYFYMSNTGATLQTLTLSNGRYFANIGDLITQLNADAVAQTLPITFQYSSTTARISVAHNTIGQTIRMAPSSAWLTRFSLNTRLGFESSGTSSAQSITATMLPNLIRTKVLYVLCNIATNDSISTDGLRTSIAKVPVNSIFGGMTIYQPPEKNWCRIVPSQYQNINVSILDDQYQPYELKRDEYCELEIVFKYE